MSEGLQEDGQPVGAADYAADRVNSGADTDTSTEAGLGEGNTYDPLEDDIPATEDGQPVGAADVDADVDRSR